MKGSKEGKGDGGKTAGPALFPRLHVTETKRAGPRGPPRNKMALYEQLLIPSHKYKPTAATLPSSGRAMNNSMTTPIYPPQVQWPASSFDSRYMPTSYMPSIVPMPYMPMAMNVGVYGAGGGGGASATSSMNASSTRSTVVDATTESQRVPRNGEADSRQQDDDFAVPTYSATQASSQTRASGNPFQVEQGSRGCRGAQKGKELVMEKRSGASVDEVRRMRKERSMEDDASWTSASVECMTVSVVDDDVNTQELKNKKADGDRRDCGGSETGLRAGQIGQERMKEQKEEGLSNLSNTTSSGGARPEVIDSERAVPEQDVFSGQSSENQSGEVSEPSQPIRGSIRDMIDAFGQQEFWKAQSTIIRQQKLFARQVFDLHRVIEVQQLLAKKPTLSLNIDEVLVEEEADNVPIPASPVADVPLVPEIPERGLETDGSQSSEENSRPVPEAVYQSIYPLPVPMQQDFNSGSAWQTAPFGANPWASRMGLPFMYVPYPGSCPPGYGMYPTMGTPMPMLGSSGGMQGTRFPAWQQPGMSQPWGVQESVVAAAAGWYGEQPAVSTAGGAAKMGVQGGVCNSDRPTSSAANHSIQGSNASNGSGRKSGERGDAGANRLSKVDDVKNCGWAKGWGSTEERVVRREVGASQSKECVAGPSIGYELGRREGGVGREDGVFGAGQQKNNGNKGAELEERGGGASACGRERMGLEPERSWPSGASYEGPLQNRTLVRPHTVVPGSEGSPWLRMMSPSKRIGQQNGVIKAVPRAVSATPELTASILLSIQKERQR